MIQRMMYGRPIPIHTEEINNQQSINQVQRSATKFADILQQKIGTSEDLKFSAHASQRLEQRSIFLSASDHAKLNEAVSKIAEKGGKESLIIMDEVSYLVSVPNRTVITAMDMESARDNVFTNIDSTLIIR